MFSSVVLADMVCWHKSRDLVPVVKNSWLWNLMREILSSEPLEAMPPVPFRQKRSMGLTLAESELTKLDVERDKDRVTLEKERACAEQIVAKIEEVL